MSSCKTQEENRLGRLIINTHRLTHAPLSLLGRFFWSFFCPLFLMRASKHVTGHSSQAASSSGPFGASLYKEMLQMYIRLRQPAALPTRPPHLHLARWCLISEGACANGAFDEIQLLSKTSRLETLQTEQSI